jgi:hypothetical protein
VMLNEREVRGLKIGLEHVPRGVHCLLGRTHFRDDDETLACGVKLAAQTGWRESSDMPM